MITRRAKGARIRSAVLLAVLAAMLAVFRFRHELFDPAWDRPVRLLTAAALLGLGWAFAREVQRSLEPALYRRLEQILNMLRETLTASGVDAGSAEDLIGSTVAALDFGLAEAENPPLAPDERKEEPEQRGGRS